MFHILAFILLVTSQASVAAYNCKSLLDSNREIAIAHFKNGGPIHDYGRQVNPMTAAQYRELDLHLLAVSLGKNAETSFGKRRIAWLLANPWSNPASIIAAQTGVRELHENRALREAVVHALASIRNFERHYMIEDRMTSWVYEKVLRTKTDPKDLMERDALAFLKPFTDEPTPRRKVYNAVQRFAVPALALAGKLTGQRMLFGTASTMNTATMRHRRKEIHDLTMFTITFRSLSKALLTHAKSDYLRSLGEFLAMVDKKQDPLDVKELVSKIESVLYQPTSGSVVDNLFLMNLPIERAAATVREKIHLLAGLTSATAEVDALLSFSRLLSASTAEKPYTLPHIIEDSEQAPVATQVSIIDGRNALLDLSKPEVPVPNHAVLAADQSLGDRVLFLTGENAGGKTTYVRQIAQAVVLAQVGAPVPATSARLTPVLLLSTMQRADSTLDGTSLFRNEIRRVKALIDALDGTRHALVLTDELFSGTSHDQKIAAETAFLRYLHGRGLLAIASSHSHELGNLEAELGGFRNIQIGGLSEHPFKVTRGVSPVRNALKIMAEEQLPDELRRLAEDEYGFKKD